MSEDDYLELVDDIDEILNEFEMRCARLQTSIRSRIEDIPTEEKPAESKRQEEPSEGQKK
jgi:hypothetical protein